MTRRNRRLRKCRSRKTAGAVLGAAAAAACLAAFRKWRSGWDARDEEASRSMPLDEEVERPTYVTNRAITIRASPEEVWPWIVQMGELPRGGFYSYLTVERILGMKVVNADEILPEFQYPKVGDAFDRAGTMLVKAIEPARLLVLGPPPLPDFASTWALALTPAGDGSTRLLSRVRARLPRGAKGVLWFLVLDPGQFLMERKMFLEIQKRAERRAGAGPPRAPFAGR